MINELQMLREMLYVPCLGNCLSTIPCAIYPYITEDIDSDTVKDENRANSAPAKRAPNLFPLYCPFVKIKPCFISFRVNLERVIRV